MFQSDTSIVLEKQEAVSRATTKIDRRSRTLLLNLPHPERVVRRYMCSYSAPYFLLPPLELISLGAIVQQFEGDEVELFDAIAEDADMEQTMQHIAQYNPDMIISLSGFEMFDTDMQVLKELKNAFPKKTFVLFGHYATQFSKEILEEIPVDYIIQGEPDLIFRDLYETWKQEGDFTGVKGIAYKNDNGEIVLQRGDLRLPDPSKLPMPAYELLTKNDEYYEPFLPKPYGLIQTARGCPYQCNYCVKSYGTKLTSRTPEQIVEEIKVLKKLYGIKSLRFIDDTFTAIPKRVIEICKLMVEEQVNVKWTCLSRADTMNEEMLRWMKKSGCQRIYIGVESGSQRVLDYYKKKVDVEEALRNISLCKKLGIETTGFFISGIPEETEEDFQQTLDFALKSDLTFATMAKLMPYPGTPLYPIMKDHMDFSLMPYKNEYKDQALNDRYVAWEKEFYRRYYLRPSYLLKTALRALTKPVETFTIAYKLLGGVFIPSKRKDNGFFLG